MKKERTKKMVTMTLDRELMMRLEDWIVKQKFPPRKNAVVEDALREYLKEKKDGV